MNKSLAKIIWGLFFLFFNINYLYLNILMPVLGLILLVTGLYQLKKINSIIKSAFYLSIFQCFLLIGGLVIYCTEYNTNASINGIYGLISSFFILFLLYHVISGLRKIALDMNIIKANSNLKGCILLYFLSIILMLIHYINNSLFIFILPLIIIFYITILFKFKGYKNAVTKALNSDEENIPFIPKLTIKYWMVLSLAIIILITTCFSFLYSTNAPNTDTEIFIINDIVETEQISDIRAKMLELGFDEVVLNDIPNSEIMKYKGIKNVNKTEQVEISDGGELQLISYVCQLEENVIKFLEYYKWIKSPRHCYTDLIGFSYNNQEFVFPINYNCVTLFDKKENKNTVTYKANYVEKNNFMPGIAAKFRVLGNGATNQRGYITFEMLYNSSLTQLYGTVILYVHQSSILNMPYTDSLSFYRTTGASSNSDDLVFKRYILGTMETYYGKNTIDE